MFWRGRHNVGDWILLTFGDPGNGESIKADGVIIDREMVGTTDGAEYIYDVMLRGGERLGGLAESDLE